jgi:glycosyltransferase involved in cell wall biosynthesis
VVSVHDLTPLHHPELCNRATLAFPELIRKALRRGAWVHTDSAFVAGEVIDAFDVDPSRVRAVQPGVPPLPAIAPEVARSLVEPFLPSGVSRYVLAVGTAEPRKDLPGLVRAFDRLAERHQDLALLLAGPPGWGEDALHAALDRARFRSRVVRTGWLEPSTLAAILTRASVLAFPSLYEGFGFPPLEAMAAGVPVVATRAGSLPEVLGDGASMVDVGDSDGLVDALDRILDDPVWRERLVAAGGDRAASFSWERCGEGLTRLYRDVAAGRDV